MLLLKLFLIFYIRVYLSSILNFKNTLSDFTQSSKQNISLSKQTPTGAICNKNSPIYKQRFERATHSAQIIRCPRTDSARRPIYQDFIRLGGGRFVSLRGATQTAPIYVCMHVYVCTIISLRLISHANLVAQNMRR
jgi:hypothetical protein